MKKLKYEEMIYYPAEQRELIIKVVNIALQKGDSALNSIEMEIKNFEEWLTNIPGTQQAIEGLKEANKEKFEILERIELLKHNLDIVEKYEKELKEHKSDDETLNKKVLH